MTAQRRLRKVSNCHRRRRCCRHYCCHPPCRITYCRRCSRRRQHCSAVAAAPSRYRRHPTTSYTALAMSACHPLRARALTLAAPKPAPYPRLHPHALPRPSRETYPWLHSHVGMPPLMCLHANPTAPARCPYRALSLSRPRAALATPMCHHVASAGCPCRARASPCRFRTPLYRACTPPFPRHHAALATPDCCSTFIGAQPSHARALPKRRPRPHALPKLSRATCPWMCLRACAPARPVPNHAHSLLQTVPADNMLIRHDNT